MRPTTPRTNPDSRIPALDGFRGIAILLVTLGRVTMLHRKATLARMLHRVDGPLVGLLLLAFAVRVWGITWQLPWLLHADEGHYSGGALKMWAARDPNPHYFINPSLLTYWLAAQYVPLRGALELSRLLLHGWGYPAALFGTPDGSARIVGEYLIGRLNSAALGTATIWATYSLGRIMLGRPVALLAGAFLALDFLHVRNSHYATNDVPATFLLVLSLIFAARLSERPGGKAYLLAGLFGGLATGTKYSMGLFLAPLLIGHGLAWRHRALSAPALRLLLVAGLTSGIAFVATNPFAVLDWRAFLVDFHSQYKLGFSPWYPQAPGSTPLLRYLFALVQAMGYVQVLLVVLGLGIGLLRGRRAAVLLGAFPFAYLLFMATIELFFVRFALPLLPPLCVLAGLGGQVLATNLASVIRRPGVAFVLAVIVLLQPAIAIVQHNLLITRDDTRVLASRWAMEHLAGKGAIAIYDHEWDGGLLSLPAPAGGWPVGGLEFTVAKPQTNTQDGVHPDTGASRFLVVSSFVQDPRRLTFSAKGWDWPDALERWLDEWVACGDRLATFVPGVDGGSVPFWRDDAYTPFWDLGAWVRPGPTIKIYELHR
jgi:4-amino-4-deoxy-L-arabinose transferase-like glycosyltransferase